MKSCRRRYLSPNRRLFSRTPVYCVARSFLLLYVGEGGMPRPWANFLHIGRSASTLANNARKASKDSDLLRALQAEISHELSSSSHRCQDKPAGSLDDFKLTWDSPDSRDILLQKKCQTGEEVVVSALLHPDDRDLEVPFDVKMKVCLKKPLVSSILQFDCLIPGFNQGGSKFEIYGANILPSSTSVGLSDYRGPLFSSLDPGLQDELKEYLAARGIGDNLVNFLRFHLHEKEQNQYVNWLETLEKMVSREE